MTTVKSITLTPALFTILVTEHKDAQHNAVALDLFKKSYTLTEFSELQGEWAENMASSLEAASGFEEDHVDNQQGSWMKEISFIVKGKKIILHPEDRMVFVIREGITEAYHEDNFYPNSITYPDGSRKEQWEAPDLLRGSDLMAYETVNAKGEVVAYRRFTYVPNGPDSTRFKMELLSEKGVRFQNGTAKRMEGKTYIHWTSDRQGFCILDESKDPEVVLKRSGLHVYTYGTFNGNKVRISHNTPKNKVEFLWEKTPTGGVSLSAIISRGDVQRETGVVAKTLIVTK